jgi:hypothetical protein
MKTMMRLLFVSIAAIVCANASAQNSINDLFNTYVIVPTQQRIQILTDELNQVNTQILNLQDQLANATATAEQGGDADVVNPPSPLVAQIAELQARATELQTSLSYWQNQLAGWLAFNTQQQEQYLVANHEQIMPDVSADDLNNALGSPVNNRLGPMPDPNNPWVVPVFVSSGDAQVDAEIILEWLQQHGLVDDHQ